MLRIENYVLIYIYLCACIIVFNLAFVFVRKRQEAQMVRRAQKFGAIIRCQLQLYDEGQPFSPDLQERLGRKLKKQQYLMAFHEAVLPYLDQKDRRIMEYLAACRPLFAYAGRAYLKKDLMQQGCFAYLMSIYSPERNQPEGMLTKIMFDILLRKSVFCRENALKALYSFGNVDSVVKAYKLLNHNHIHHNGKLVTDGLFTFAGDHEKLTAVLWDIFPTLAPDLQVALINYIKLVSGDFCEKFYVLLININEDKEIRLAVIRYFGKFAYEPARDFMLEYMVNEQEIEWEYLSVCATTLARYDTPEVRKVLRQALSSRHWYVRFNAAESLLRMGVDYQELVSVYNGQDRYAREMLEYKRLATQISSAG